MQTDARISVMPESHHGYTFLPRPVRITGRLVLLASLLALAPPVVLRAQESGHADAATIDIDKVIAGIQKDMVAIPGGSFQMGDLYRKGEADEAPVHKVNIKTFKLNRYEVTFEQWDACLADGGCYSHRPADNGWGRADRPVINITWYDAQNFIDWLNNRTGRHYRFPSEAEWEYAARAGTRTEFGWGDEPGTNRARCAGCGNPDAQETTSPVGSFRANLFGLYDMHGNVWEWVADCWNSSYRGAPADGSAWTSGDCSKRVIRGGGWFSKPQVLRSSNRSFNEHSLAYSSPGFRIAHD